MNPAKQNLGAADSEIRSQTGDEADNQPDGGTPDSGGQRPGAQAGSRPGGRQRRRLIVRVARTGLGVLLALICAYASVCWRTLHSAAAAFTAGDLEETVRLSKRFDALSPVEKHKPPFNIGTVAAAESRFDDAQPLLERALTLTPEHDECAVRINLSFVYEQQATGFAEAKKTTEANAKFDAARTTLTDAPESCRPQGSASDEQMTESAERIDQEQQEMNDPSAGDDTGAESGAGENEEDGKKDDGKKDSKGNGPGEDGEQDPGTDAGGDESDDPGEDTGDGASGSPGGDGKQRPETEQERKQRQLDERNDTADQRQQDSEEHTKGRRDGAKPW